MLYRLLLYCLLLPAFISASDANTYVILTLNGDEKIMVYALDKEKSELSLLNDYHTPGKPSAFTANRDGTRLYVAMKTNEAIASYSLSSEEKISPLGESMVGGGASFLSIDPSGNYLLSSYYVAGKVAVNKIGPNGELHSKPLQTFETDERAHAIVLHPTGNFANVPHTRPNAIHQFRFDNKKGSLHPHHKPVPSRDPNTGPRHLSFRPDGKFVYGSDEQGKSITAYRYDTTNGNLNVMQTLPSFPQDALEASGSTSDIEVHPSGKFVYISNRGPDTIASFSIDDKSGHLNLMDQTPTEHITRSFNISPDGQHLIAAGQKSGNVAVFKIDAFGHLERTQTLAAGKNPWWVQIVER